MAPPEVGTHVTYRRLESAGKDGKHPISSFPGIVLGQHPDGTAQVAFLDPSRLHVLSGADWRDAFECSYSLPLGQGEGRDWYEALAEPLANTEPPNSKPSAADLDVVAEEEKSKEATKGNGRKLVAFKPK